MNRVNAYASRVILLALCFSALGASFREPKLQTFEHAVEHTTTGKRATLRYGTANTLEDYAYTIRLTLVRDTMGRCVEVTIETDNAWTITQNCKKQRFCSPAEMTAAVDRFLKQTGIQDETVEFKQGEAIHRLQLAELLNERRLLKDKWFHVQYKKLSWGPKTDELVVEARP